MFKGFDRAIWIRFFGTMLLSVGNNMIRPFLALYLATSLDAGYGMIGFVLMVRPLGSFFGNMLGGYYADKIGRKPVMVGGLAFDALCLFGYALAHNPLWFAGLSFLQGISGSIAEPASSAMIADVTKEEDRARAYSLLYMGINVGAVIGPLLAVGVILSHPSALFASMAALTLLFSLIVSLFIPESKPDNIACESEACRTSQGKIGFGFLFKDFNLLLLLIGSVAVSLGNNQMDSYLPLYLKDLLPQAAWLYGAMLSMNGILCVILSMPLANYLGRYNPYRVMQISGGVYAIGMLLIAMSQSVAGMFAGYFVLTIGELFQSSVWRKLLADLAPADMRARYMGAGSIAWIVAGTLGPLSGGQLMKYYGGHVMFLIFTVVMASSLIFYRWLYLRRLKEQRKAASDAEKFPFAM